MRIGAVIPTLYHPSTLRPLLAILKSDGVDVELIETKGREPDIYRWWQEGVDALRKRGVDTIAVLNDDIVILPGALPFMAKALRSDPTVAVVSPELTEWARPTWKMNVPREVVLKHSVGHGTPWTTPAFTGWNFMFKAELDLPRFDESYRWYWGDQAFEEDVRKAGFRVASVIGLVAGHLGATTSKRVGKSALDPLKRADLDLWYERHKTVTADNTPAGGSIPRILHRMNLGGEPPEDATRYWALWQKLMPDWEFRLHGNPVADAAEWPLTSWLWSNVPHVVQMADLMRYELMWREGGVYVDWDMEPYRPLDVFLPLEGFVSYENHGTTGSAIMGFRPHHPAAGRMVDIGLERCAADRDNMMGVGPYTVTAAVRERLDVLKLPPASFFAEEWGDRRFLQDQAYSVLPWTYGLHRMHASWIKDHPWQPNHGFADGTLPSKESALAYVEMMLGLGITVPLPEEWRGRPRSSRLSGGRAPRETKL